MCTNWEHFYQILLKIWFLSSNVVGGIWQLLILLLLFARKRLSISMWHAELFHFCVCIFMQKQGCTEDILFYVCIFVCLYINFILVWIFLCTQDIQGSFVYIFLGSSTATLTNLWPWPCGPWMTPPRECCSTYKSYFSLSPFFWKKILTVWYP